MMKRQPKVLFLRRLRSLRMNKLFLFFSIVLLCAGCAGGDSSGEEEESSFKRTASGAWEALNFAKNVTNPAYYVQKGAKAAYNKIKEEKSESDK